MALDMLVRLPARPLTLDDVAAIAASSPDLRYELHKGVLTVMPPADTEHAGIITRLTVWLVMSGLDPLQVLVNAGVRVSRDDGGTGRSPDLLVRHDVATSKAVWLDPAGIRLVVEVVSPGSEELDRIIKPVEYARAGVTHFWRVERATGSQATVHMYRLGVDERGAPAYIGHQDIALDTLLSGAVPELA